MKKYIYVITLIFITSISFLSCKNDDDVYNVYHEYITSSFGDQQNALQVNSKMTFIDLSRGVISRKWTFPDCTIDDNMNPIVNSTAQHVKVAFTKPGSYKIKIEQVYGDNFYDDEIKGVSDSKNNEKYVDVLVLDSVHATFDAFTEDETKVKVDNKTLSEVEAGHVIKFVSTATGMPTTTKWTIYNSNFSSDIEGEQGIGNFKFSVPGIYSISFYAKNEQGGEDKITYQDAIKVIPSDDPLTLDEIQRTESDVIGLVFGRAMDNSLGNEKAISVSIIDSHDNSVKVNVLSVTTADNIVNIKLDKKIYNSDIITVSYDKSKGNLKTLDGMSAESFDNVALTNFKNANILKESGWDVGFESTDKTNWPNGGWGDPWDKYNFDVVSTSPHNGKKCAYISLGAGEGFVFLHNKNGGAVTFPTELNKEYVVGFWARVEDLGEETTESAKIPDLRFYYSPDTDWNVGGAGFPKGTEINKWIYKTVVIPACASAGQHQFMVRVNNTGNSKSLKIYLDDFTMYEYEPRP